MNVKEKQIVIETMQHIFGAEKLTDKQYVGLAWKHKRTKRFEIKRQASSNRDDSYPRYTFTHAQAKFLLHLAQRRERKYGGKNHWVVIRAEAAYAMHTGQRIDRDAPETLFPDGAVIATFTDVKSHIRLNPGSFLVNTKIENVTVTLIGWRSDVGTFRPMWQKGPKPLDK